jgi:hypothetical protein
MNKSMKLGWKPTNPLEKTIYRPNSGLLQTPSKDEEQNKSTTRSQTRKAQDKTVERLYSNAQQMRLQKAIYEQEKIRQEVEGCTFLPNADKYRPSTARQLGSSLLMSVSLKKNGHQETEIRSINVGSESVTDRKAIINPIRENGKLNSSSKKEPTS